MKVRSNFVLFSSYARLRTQAYHPLFVWSTVLFDGRYGYEFWIAFLYDAIFTAV